MVLPKQVSHTLSRQEKSYDHSKFTLQRKQQRSRLCVSWQRSVSVNWMSH